MPTGAECTPLPHYATATKVVNIPTLSRTKTVRLRSENCHCHHQFCNSESATEHADANLVFVLPSDQSTGWSV